MTGLKRGGVHTEWNIIQNKKDELLPFTTTWMDLENIILSKVSDRERQIVLLYNTTYMWNLKPNTNECTVYTKQKQTHRYRKQTCAYQRVKGRGEGQIRGMGLTDTNYYI